MKVSRISETIAALVLDCGRMVLIDQSVLTSQLSCGFANGGTWTGYIANHYWRVRHRGHTHYCITDSGGRIVALHRIIMGATGNVEVDHRDGNGLNNLRSNLRLATNAQNAKNRISTVGASRYKGVSIFGKRWRAKIESDGVRFSLGIYNTQEEAARVYDAAAIRLHGEFARLNFPIEQGVTQ
jgi:hypothetical protein